MEGKQEGKAFFNVEGEDRPGKKGSYPGRGGGQGQKDSGQLRDCDVRREAGFLMC